MATKGDRVRDSFADSESFRPASKGGRLQSEWVVDFRRNRWPDCFGITGRFASDYATKATFLIDCTEYFRFTRTIFLYPIGIAVLPGTEVTAKGWEAAVPAVGSYSPTGDANINGVLSGVKWATSSLTFSFPTDGSLYGSSYGSSEHLNNFEVFTAQQQTAVRTILQMYSSVANLTFTEVTETSATHGDLRYAETDAVNTAWAYYPSTSAAGGDAWFNNSKNLYDYPDQGQLRLPHHDARNRARARTEAST